MKIHVYVAKEDSDFEDDWGPYKFIVTLTAGSTLLAALITIEDRAFGSTNCLYASTHFPCFLIKLLLL